MSQAIRKHFVTFMSPGTLFSESSSKEISSWDVEEAVKIAQNITERYNAKPYGFQFETYITHPPVNDGEGGTLQVNSRRVVSSGIYFLGGDIETYDDVMSRNLSSEEILRSNMRNNDYAIIVVNRNSFRSTLPFGEKDFIVDPTNGRIIWHGDNPRWVAYREEVKAKIIAYREEEDKKWKAKHGNHSV